MDTGIKMKSKGSDAVRELHNGLSGTGETVYLVVTVDDEGNWKHIARFENEAEALNWMEYC